ncbi:MAG: M20/M25/M40 family metallo-hydrolase [Acidobacteriota bacterium]
MKHLTILGLLVFATSLPAPATASSSKAVLQQAERLRDAALTDETAWKWVEGLTTEVGPRLAGTPEEKRAREWTVRSLKELGFPARSIRVEPFPVDTWVRGGETARIVSPFPQPLVVTALGRSGATSEEGLEAEVAVFKTLAELEAQPDGALKGRIAYISHAMRKTQDGSSYGYFGRVRFRGPSIAASKGAVGCMIRSVGTQHHRLPHTGGTGWGDVPRVPAVALSPPDADQIERIAARGETIRVAMTVTPRVLGTRQSGNVIVDLVGSKRPEEIVVVGGHLDSWDLGTGAVDDGAGVAITTAAVNLIRKSGRRPARTIRLIHWGSEEVGLVGAKAYAERHADSIDQHVIGSESDFGGDRVFQIGGHVSDEGQVVVDEMLRLLAPLGVGRGPMGRSFLGSSGPDLSPLNAAGLPRFRLDQDGRDYFDYHHTPDDTLDKIDPEALRQNVAAYVVFLWLAANTDAQFRPEIADTTVRE